MSDVHVVIVGGGFAGLNAAKALRNRPGVAVTLLDRQNHHLFQPLLYQVAMAALSPADIAAPIRSILSDSRNVRVLQATAQAVDVAAREVRTDAGIFAYDYLLLCCGATHAYFGHEEWEPWAPGLKSLPQATEIRTRVLSAFETAERLDDAQDQQRWLTFVVVGGGPTGVELAGAIGEISRYTLARDFRKIDPRRTRVILLEAGPRILPSFQPRSAERATRDLESLGVKVRTNARVTAISAAGVEIADPPPAIAGPPPATVPGRRKVAARSASVRYAGKRSISRSRFARRQARTASSRSAPSRGTPPGASRRSTRLRSGAPLRRCAPSCWEKSASCSSSTGEKFTTAAAPGQDSRCTAMST